MDFCLNDFDDWLSIGSSIIYLSLSMNIYDFFSIPYYSTSLNSVYNYCIYFSSSAFSSIFLNLHYSATFYVDKYSVNSYW